MIVITSKENKTVLGFGESIDYMENGYPRLVNENIAFPVDGVDVNEVDSIPEEVEMDKYCYSTEDGFYLNPEWVEPDPTNIYGIPDDVYHQIIDDYTMEMLEGDLNA